eukprot:365649-Chlamydomonas_euryale.AAC.4
MLGFDPPTADSTRPANARPAGWCHEHACLSALPEKHDCVPRGPLCVTLALHTSTLVQVVSARSALYPLLAASEDPLRVRCGRHARLCTSMGFRGIETW